MQASTVRVPSPPLDWREVKHLVPIEVVARAVLGPPPGGGNRWPCPFHEGTHPNLSVVPGKGWRCHKCGEKGDAIAMVMKAEGLSFPDAVRRAAEICGLDADAPFQGPRRQHRPEPVKTIEAPAPPSRGIDPDDAARIVAEAGGRLRGPRGGSGLAWLAGPRRGLDVATVRRFRLGLVERLIGESSSGRTYSASGVLTPWFGAAGEVVKLSVRQSDSRPEGAPKYVHFAVKGRLPSVFPSPAAVEPGRPLVIAEGEFDVMLLDQEIGGLACVVSFGSASARVDPEVMEAALSCPSWFVAHDADKAGDDAAARWLNFPWATRVSPPSPAKDWTEAHALDFNVVRNHWRRFLREGLPSWEELKTWRWGPALDREPPPLDAEPDEIDEREWIEERCAIALADGRDPPESVRPFAEWIDEYRRIRGAASVRAEPAAVADPVDAAWRAELDRLVKAGDLVLVREEMEEDR